MRNVVGGRSRQPGAGLGTEARVVRVYDGQAYYYQQQPQTYDGYGNQYQQPQRYYPPRNMYGYPD